MDVTFRPLVDPTWLTPAAKRTRSPFDAGWTSTMEILERELRQRSARDVVVQGEWTERQIRLDGWPRADARPAGPAVAVSFATSRFGQHARLVHGPREQYRCDRFIYWQDNLRAIALGLEALRKVERYGISDRGEARAGFREIAAGTSAPDLSDPAEMLAHLLGGLTAEKVREAAAFQPGALRRRIARELHPDAGGHEDAFRTALSALDTLRGA